MPVPDDRIESLIAAAVAGQLTPREEEELASLTRDHPWIPLEIDRLGGLSRRLSESGITWSDPAVTAALRERTLGALPSAAGRAGTTTEDPRPARRSWLTPLLAAACLAVGIAVGAGVPALTSAPPSGPPGTLGAVERLDPRAVASGVEVEADLVAHTWGTEAVLDVTGLQAGETYAVVFIGADGAEYSAGEMLGSSVPIHCRLNAAVLREDAARLEIRDADSDVVAAAALPPA